ncbi:MAG TPA: HAD family hydrolase [Chiayiivirga sp.]|jgi:putative hydrolase of the HAD superfamily|nr:HAD family hydrolase [Xanthomonadaceae bacterium]MDX9765060.1 HAD family hydrolase [Chiayiivirga sp.]MEB2316266.1 HAD family hydrolase [Xanthomonadaceae bacterium]HRN59979.1 HAD family hydrolase [Chiayiivirga sp.]HRO87963.1 HAD family hydrolase [Chiayiivirga sp.]
MIPTIPVPASVPSKPGQRSPARPITLVGFDADDTLWHSEIHFRAAHAEFERILSPYLDLADSALHDRLLATEKANILLFGYGAKGMTLSMLETAVAMTDARIGAADLARILDLGKEVLRHPVELLPDIRSAVESVAAVHDIVLITKGDLFHQEAKIAASGLTDLFTRIEIVSEKDPASYARVIAECGGAPHEFAMVGNSLRSDIAPVLALGGWGVHMPYPVTWALEMVHDVADDDPRVQRIDGPAQIPLAIARLEALASSARFSAG